MKKILSIILAAAMLCGMCTVVGGAEIIGTSTILGDADGDGFVTAIDASYVLQKVAETEVEIDETAADVDGDGFITAIDASYILQYVAEIIDEFPVS